MVSALTLGLASARFTGTILHGLSTHTRSDFAWFRVFGLGVSGLWFGAQAWAFKACVGLRAALLKGSSSLLGFRSQGGFG